MAISGASPSDTHYLVSQCYEALYEPQYMSELVRKLQNRGSRFNQRQIFEAVDILLGKERIKKAFVKLIRGEETHDLVTVDGEVVDEWKDYALLWVPFEDKNPEIIDDKRKEGYIPDMEIATKVNIIQRLSKNGYYNARNVEKIFSELINEEFYGEEIETSSFESPEADVKVKSTTPKYIFEISSRYENPINNFYIDTKLEFIRSGFDIYVFAPKFSQTLKSKYRDHGFVNLKYIIDKESKFPVVKPLTFFSPIDIKQFKKDLDVVEREYSVISEKEFRESIREKLEV